MGVVFGGGEVAEDDEAWACGCAGEGDGYHVDVREFLGVC